MRKLIFFLVGALMLACSEDEPNPNADFNLSKEKVYLEEDVQFTNLSTDASRYHWDFGDGTSSEQEHPSHAYNQSGEMCICLTSFGNGESTCDKFIEVFDGTSSYKVFNATSISFDILSYFYDGDNVIDLVEHGNINSGAMTDTIFTSRSVIMLGGVYYGQLFIVETPYPLEKGINNILEINDNTRIFSGVNNLKSTGEKITLKKYIEEYE